MNNFKFILLISPFLLVFFTKILLKYKLYSKTKKPTKKLIIITLNNYKNYIINKILYD